MPPIAETSSLSHLAPPFNPSPRPSKRLRVPPPEVPQELGELIKRDVLLLQQMGWQNFVKLRRRRGDLSSLKFPHPASRLLQHYKFHGAPVKLHTQPWTPQQISNALQRGPHRSSLQYIDYLEEEFVDMINKGQWLILPFSTAKHLPNLRISPPGVIPQRGRRPRWICDYTWSGVNGDTIPLAPLESMQFGNALDRFLRELLLADPKLGPIFMLKLDISDGFYRMAVAPTDIPKLGVAFPTRPGSEPLIALPLVLPMGWKNSPPVFSAATETSADIANTALQSRMPANPHPLDAHAAILDDPISNDVQTSNNATTTSTTTPPTSTLPPPIRDPCLPPQPSPASYVDVFVDDFIALCQGYTQ